MAAKKKVAYEPHTVPAKITVTSRCAVKIRDNYYTMEAALERQVVNPEGIDMQEEWLSAFDEVNSTVDRQIQETLDTFKNKK